MVKPLNKCQEEFAKEVVLNGGDKVAAFKSSGWKWENFSLKSLGVEADKKYNHPRINLRIAELKRESDKIAKESFTITVKQRLEWLKEITEAGLDTFKDNAGNKRRESLTAARSAIETMNTMLGVSDDSSLNAEPLTISFQVSAPVKEIKITNANT